MTFRRRSPSRWCAAVAVTCVAVLALLWVAPRVSAQVAAWLAAAPVKASAVVITMGAADDVSRQDGATDVRAVDPGIQFNALGFVCTHHDARASLQYRVRAEEESWSEWRTASFEEVREGSGPRRLVTDAEWVGAARYVECRGAPGMRVKVAAINVLGDATTGDRVADAVRGAVAAVAGIAAGDEASAATARPAIVTRAKWGANESWRRRGPRYGSVKLAVVHHTAGGNTYTRTQAPAVVRAVYYYHTKVCGFADIGYNFLIDRYGTIYEGRYGGMTRAVVGAQALGFNSCSTGVSVMGEFSATQPPTAAVAALERLLAWKLDLHHIDPLSRVSARCTDTDRFRAGTTVRVAAIAGHRQLCYTTCPGDAFQAILPTVRKVVADTGRPKIYAFNALPAAISPNGDGVSDEAVVEFIGSETVDWRVDVADDSATVREFAGLDKVVSLAWDGRDATGVALPDGSYAITGFASSEAGEARPGTATVIIDTVRPGLTVGPPKPGVVDPHGGPVGAHAVVRYQIEEPCRVRVVVYDADGTSMRRLQGWTAKTAAAHSVQWDGRVTQDGALRAAPEGQYRIEVSARDVAGNRSTQSTQVTIDRTLRPGAATVYLSPNGDGRSDVATLSYRLTRAAQLTASIVQDGGTVRSFAACDLEAGTHAVVWDGQTDAGARAPAGRYTVVLSAATGAEPCRAGANAVLDVGKPRLSATGPRRSRVRRWVSVRCAVRDTWGPTVDVTARVRTAAGKLVRTVVRRGVPVGTACAIPFRPTKRGRYCVTFTGVDRAGNRQRAAAVWCVRVR